MLLRIGTRGFLFCIQWFPSLILYTLLKHTMLFAERSRKSHDDDVIRRTGTHANEKWGVSVSCTEWFDGQTKTEAYA